MALQSLEVLLKSVNEASVILVLPRKTLWLVEGNFYGRSLDHDDLPRGALGPFCWWYASMRFCPTIPVDF